MHKLVIDPITRIEGHLKVEVIVDDGEVKQAYTTGTLFRGLEIILRSRDPRDATQLTQRICGVCPICHATASALAIDNACGIADKITDNARIIRNLILGANFIQSHILHFYHLTALDYVDVTAATDASDKYPQLQAITDFIHRGEPAPFLPRYEGDYRLTKDENLSLLSHYLTALEIRRKAHEMLAVFGGKMPHNVGIVTGGVTITPTVDKITNFLWRLNELREFINTIYLPDVITVAAKYPDIFQLGIGCGNYLTYGVFDLEGTNPNYTQRIRMLNSGTTNITDLKYTRFNPELITEQVKNSWYDNTGTNKHPFQGITIPQKNKETAYSWLKSPRYNRTVYEVGPLARILVNYTRPDSEIKPIIDEYLTKYKLNPTDLNSVGGRHLTRAIECKLIADAMSLWVLELKPEQEVFTEFNIPETAQGAGFTEGPRGALGHWIKIKDNKIDNYQCIVPTTWNASPRDDTDTPGPMEQALQGTKVKDLNNPFEIVRIIRSFDPCLACAVHLLKPNGETINIISEHWL